MMVAYREEVDKIAKRILGYEVKYVPREQNEAADLLSKLGSGCKRIPPGVFQEHLRTPSVKGADIDNPDRVDSFVNMVTKVPTAWTKPFIEYLENGTLPDDEVERRQIVRRAKGYTVINGQLYKRSTIGVYLKCVSQLEGMEILREIHLGDCGHHVAPRSLVAKAFRQGFYWLAAKADADKLVETCMGCQYYA